MLRHGYTTALASGRTVNLAAGLLMRIDPATIPVLRVAVAIGATRMARAAAIALLALGCVVALLVWRPDLLRPGDIGTDASNYFAGGQRLADGTELYALSAGDRPAPADNAPYWTVPLLSPPPIAVAWMPAALILPGVAAMYGWWALGLVGTMGTAFLATRRATLLALLGIIVLSPAIALTAISGNLNALLIPAYAFTFGVARQRPSRWPTLAAALVAGTAAAFKLSPVLLIWWLLVNRRWGAAVAATLVGAGWVGASALVAPGALDEYLRISQDTAVTGATVLSATRVAEELGLPLAAATFTPIACLAGAAVAGLLLRRHPTAACIALALGTIYATPVVRIESFALLVAAVAWRDPLGMPALVRGVRPRRAALTVAPLMIVPLVVVVAAWVGSAGRSSVLIENRTTEAVVVRFGVTSQGPASFGFLVDAGEIARGFGPTPGGLAGSVEVFAGDCRQVDRGVAPRAGGRIVVAPGGVQFVDDPGTQAPFADFVDDCSGPSPSN